jgi:hypothetical protein
MPPFKTVFIKLLLFLCAYGLLIGFFKIPAVRSGTIHAYAKSAQWFLKNTLNQGYFVANATGTSTLKPGTEFIQILFGNEATLTAQATAAAASGQKEANLALQEFKIKFDEFFLFSALFFVALVLISPLSWIKKLKLATIGILALWLFSLIKLDAYALHYFAQMRIGVYELTGWSLRFVTTVYLNLKVGIGYILATILWAILLFRQNEWRDVLTQWMHKSGE